MKNLLLAILLACAPVVATTTVATTLVVTTSGCRSTSAYKTLAIIATSVDAGMKAFTDAVVAKKVGAPVQEKVRAAHGRYQKSLQAAVLAAHFDTSQAAPEDLKALATELLALITEALK